MPRRSAAEAEETRRAIVARAVDAASIEGLEGLTIGRLADDLRMSKAGVIRHFGSKAELQRVTFEEAAGRFVDHVWKPAESRRPGLERLLAVCDAWVDHVAHSPFAGGCFMTSASVEWDAREGPLHDEVKRGVERWQKTLRREVVTAVEAGELPADSDPEQIAFELYAIAMGMNQSVQLLGDRKAREKARRAQRRALGL